MNYIKLALISLTLGSAVSIADDCTAPATPTMPDGATATMEQMLAGQKAVKEYQAANTNSPGPELTNALSQLNDDYNASVSSEEAVADGFNAALRDYKKANPADVN